MGLVTLKNYILGSRATTAPTRNARNEPDLEYGISHVNDTSDSALINSSKPLLDDMSSTMLDSDSDSDDAPQAPTGRFVDPRVISDAIIGLSDGLTVPFALTAGLSALGNSKVVIFGGLAELIAGAISMGLGGWLGARSEIDAYRTLLRSTKRVITQSPTVALSVLRTTLEPLLPSTPKSNSLLDQLTTQIHHHTTSISNSPVEQRQQHAQLVKLLLLLQHNSSPEPPSGRAVRCALTIGLSYFVGGFVPLFPYFFIAEVGRAFWWSVGVMVIALGLFGFIKTAVVVFDDQEGTEEWEGNHRKWLGQRGQGILKCINGGLVMIVVGGLAAAAATGCVMLFNQWSGGDMMS